jgi:hypothetical protein
VDLGKLNDDKAINEFAIGISKFVKLDAPAQGKDGTEFKTYDFGEGLCRPI